MLGQRDLGKAERLQELFQENLARMGRDAISRNHPYVRPADTKRPLRDRGAS